MRKLSSKVFAVAAVAAAVLLSASAQAGEPNRAEANKKLVREFFAAIDEAQASGAMKAKWKGSWLRTTFSTARANRTGVKPWFAARSPRSFCPSAACRR
jgi:hypothetical protein